MERGNAKRFSAEDISLSPRITKKSVRKGAISIQFPGECNFPSLLKQKNNLFILRIAMSLSCIIVIYVHICRANDEEIMFYVRILKAVFQRTDEFCKFPLNTLDVKRPLYLDLNYLFIQTPFTIRYHKSINKFHRSLIILKCFMICGILFIMQPNNALFIISTSSECFITNA